MKARWRMVVVAFVVATTSSIYAIYATHQRREYRAKITAFAAEVGNTQTTADGVRSLLNQPRFRGLTLREDSATLWEVETPLEFGAGNWILLIELKDSRVVALRVRTEDSIEKRPKDAPPDRTF